MPMEETWEDKTHPDKVGGASQGQLRTGGAAGPRTTGRRRRRRSLGLSGGKRGGRARLG